MNRLRVKDFKICVYRSEYDSRYFIAHCMELDVIGQNLTIEGAVRQCLESIETQIKIFRESKGKIKLKFRAPSKIWERYRNSVKVGIDLQT